MTSKYYSELYNRTSNPTIRVMYNTWSCREFAQRDINSIISGSRYEGQLLTLRVGGLNMRRRYADEIEGMAKYAKMLLPDNIVSADATSIWIDILMTEIGEQVRPPREVHSLLFFYIKYLSVQMKDRVDFERVCKALIKRKHHVFSGVPDQQLGTALYFFSYVKYPKEMMEFSRILARGNGPGTAMKQLAHLQDETIDVPTKAGEFYYAVLEEWCGTFKKELLYTLNGHVESYERFWYLPVLVQDVYQRVYDGEGKFDNIEYSEDEW